MERVMRSRFLDGRCRLQIPIPHLVFRSASTSRNLFVRLQTAVPQLPLSFSQQKDIITRLRRLPNGIADARTVFDELEIVIRFLGSTGK
jgi:hypothetical protein